MTRPRALVPVVLLSAASVVGCRAKPAPAPAATPSSSSAASGAAASSPAPDRVQSLEVAELARSAQLVLDDDIVSADVRVRRAAARALARSDDPRGVEKLETLLADADPDVLSWAAFGLGQLCAKDRASITQRLVLRGAAYRLEPPLPVATLDPGWAIPRGIGRCAHPQGERSLVAWLLGPRDRARAAALALGEIAAKQHRIEEETSAALLRAAAGDAAAQALPEAFFAFSQLKQAPPRARELLLERLRSRLAVAADARVFAIRAMAPIGPDAIVDLRRVLLATGDYTPAERAEAVRVLGKIGTAEAREALVAAVDQQVPPTDPAGLTALVGPGFSVLWTAVETISAMRVGGASSSKGLQALASLPVLAEAPAPLQRRLTLLRCSAAKAIANGNPDAAVLGSCDPDPKGVDGALARIAVLGRGPLRGTRLAAWKTYASEGSPARVREAALELVAAHPEMADVAPVLASALRAQEPGVVATAAEQIAAHPDRVMTEANDKPRTRDKKKADRGAGQVDPAVAQALEAALEHKLSDDAAETTAQLALAVAAVRLDAGRAWLTSLCTSPIASLREAAQKGLSSLDGSKAACPVLASTLPVPPHGQTAPVRLTLTTDVGELTLKLDPALAPIAVARVTELARRGFYDGIAVHRVVPGFVVQFGDPGGDGYGGDGAPPMRCELSPVTFATGSVGIAIAGRDTGSSQLFVTLAPTPHLDGQYTWLGTAEGPWNVLAPGDIIRKATVAESAP